MKWNIENITWQDFDHSKVNTKLLAQAKAAALVESNAEDYVAYLKQVFRGDAQILKDIEIWGEEEKLHGLALRRWCEIADPQYDYEKEMTRFRASYRIPLDLDCSVRGSRSRELVARCIVETGTTTFYTALRDACEEPVLKEICKRIAGDEVRHFHLFLKYLNERYAAEDQLSLVSRIKTIVERIGEAEDAELTFAYFTSRLGDEFDAAHFDEYSKEYMNETIGFYRPKHFQNSVPFIAKTAGLKLMPWLTHSIGNIMYEAARFKYRHDASVFRAH